MFDELLEKTKDRSMINEKASREDYKVVAEALRKSKPKGDMKVKDGDSIEDDPVYRQWISDVQSVAGAFKMMNDLFDETLFEQACGLE